MERRCSQFEIINVGGCRAAIFCVDSVGSSRLAPNPEWLPSWFRPACKLYGRKYHRPQSLDRSGRSRCSCLPQRAIVRGSISEPNREDGGFPKELRKQLPKDRRLIVRRAWQELRRSSCSPGSHVWRGATHQGTRRRYRVLNGSSHSPTAGCPALSTLSVPMTSSRLMVARST